MSALDLYTLNNPAGVPCSPRYGMEEVFTAEPIATSSTGSKSMTAPTNLAEALDALQPFLPADRRLLIMQHNGGDNSVSITTGHDWKESEQVKGHGSASRRGRLSDALFEAERDHADKWNAKHGPLAAAEAEFGAYCPRLAA